MTAIALKQQDYIQDNIAPAESAEEKHRRIALAAEEACKNSDDFEVFIFKYTIKATSIFA